MYARNLFLLTMTIAACHSANQAVVKDDAGKDAPPGDASTARNTSVTGVLGGIAFELHYAAIKREVEGDPRNWVCAASLPVTFEECQASGLPARTVFLAPFVYDQSGQARWDFAEAGLYRTGSNATSKIASTGSVTVQNDDPGGILELTFSVNFGESAPTAGYVSSQ